MLSGLTFLDEKLFTVMESQLLSPPVHRLGGQARQVPSLLAQLRVETSGQIKCQKGLRDQKESKRLQEDVTSYSVVDFVFAVDGWEEQTKSAVRLWGFNCLGRPHSFMSPHLKCNSTSIHYQVVCAVLCPVLR